MPNLRLQEHRVPDTATSEGPFSAVLREGPLTSYRVWFSGRLFNRDALARDLDLPHRSSNQRIIAAGYERFGIELLPRLSGEFALAIADAERGRLLLARDVVGAEPLYYTRLRDGHAFGTTIRPLAALIGARPQLHDVATLIAAPRALDETATFFTGIHALPPAHALEWTHDRIRTWKYWEARGDEYAGADFAECVNAFAVLFRQSVARRSQGARRPAVLVSGGVDSSALYCVAREIAPHVLGIYYGAQDGGPADETAYIDRLEKGVARIMRLPLLPSAYPEGVTQAVEESESPVVDLLPGLSDRLNATYRELGIDVVIDATWADQTLFPFPPAYLADCWRVGQWHAVLQHLHAYPRWFEDARPRDVRLAAVRSLIRELAPGVARVVRRARPRVHNERILSHKFASQESETTKVSRWAAQQSAHGSAVAQGFLTRADTLLLEWSAKAAARHGYRGGVPFLDRDLLTLMISAPGHVQNARGTPKALLRQALKGTVPAANLMRRSKGDYTTLIDRELSRATPFLFDQLQAGRALEAGLLQPDAYTRDLAHWCSQTHISPGDAPHKLAALYAVECWLRAFFP